MGIDSSHTASHQNVKGSFKNGYKIKKNLALNNTKKLKCCEQEKPTEQKSLSPHCCCLIAVLFKGFVTLSSETAKPVSSQA